jgi:glycosyltransferase involved in cell wall biosynthesis
MSESSARITPRLTVFLPALSAGGAERVMLALVGEIARRGYLCDLVTAQSGGRWTNKVPEGVRHISLRSRKPLHAIPRLREYLRRERPQVILSSVFAANIAAIVATRGTSVRCVLREAYRAKDDARSTSQLTTISNHLALRWLYRRADAVISLSQALAEHIIGITRISKSRVFVIPNPHLPLTPQALPSRESDLIVACGRLEAQKDFKSLLNAFAQVQVTRASRLVLLGEGSQLDMLKCLAADLSIEDRVEFAGYSDDVHQWMRRAQVFVSTSRVEGFPNVLLEALASGCAVVSTASSDAVAEILENGDLGTIVPVGDVSGIAEGILAALSLAAPAATTSLTRKYDLSAVVDEYIKVLIPTGALGANSTVEQLPDRVDG